MTVFDLFSFRKRRAEGDVPDVFVYDTLPDPLRVQIVQICREAIGQRFASAGDLIHPPENNDGWQFVHDLVARELGVFHLSNETRLDERCATVILKGSVEEVLDLVEVCVRYIDRVASRFSRADRERRGIRVKASDAIEELNERFRRAGVGYAFEDGQIFRLDSELIHAEVTVPALRYLQQDGFDGPREEFLGAHAHYRAGQVKEAITAANNAFESTLKAICAQNGWQAPSGARASDLIKVVRRNGLLPDYLSASFDQLAATLKSGLPEVRNHEGGHGDGPTPQRVPDYVAAYALHLAAASITFLVEAHLQRGKL